MVPQAEPEHPAPDTLQVTAVFVFPVTVAENCCCCPVPTWAEAGDTETETPGKDWMTTDAEADFVESATDVAVTVASPGVGIVAGAVYNPVEVMEPQEPATQPIPETDQVTAVFELPVTVAVNCCFPFTDSVELVGVRETATPAEVPMVTVAVPTSERSERERAVTSTVDGLGAVEGAVYSPSELISPQPMPLQPAPESPQMTTPSADPVALNCTCPFGCTCTDAGETETEADAKLAVTRKASIDAAQVIPRVSLIPDSSRTVLCSALHSYGGNGSRITSGKSLLSRVRQRGH